MLDDKQLEQEVQNLIIDLCEVLYLRGYEMVPVGPMMRLVGVSDERASDHDGEFFPLDQEFKHMLAARKANLTQPSKKTKSRKKPRTPDGATLH